MIIKHKRRGADPMIDVVTNESAQDVVKDGEITRNVSVLTVLVESESDLDLLAEYEAGTIAYTAGFTAMWQMDADGNWATIL